MKAMFFDIGGVLLTNGWDESARKKACLKFQLDFETLNARHREVFSTYELGKISLEEYLKYLVFDEKRSFSVRDFEQFMFEQSKPYPEMLDLLASLSKQGRVKIFAVSNEGRELTDHRIEKFKLDQWIDGFIVSSFVGLRKPDPDIYHLALDIAQVDPSEVVYLDDRELFIDVAKSLGILGICHRTFLETETRLKELKILDLEKK